MDEDERVIKAIKEENTGIFYNRIRAIALRAFDALCLAAEKPVEKCPVQFCRHPKNHKGRHHFV